MPECDMCFLSLEDHDAADLFSCAAERANFEDMNAACIDTEHVQITQERLNYLEDCETALLQESA